MHENFIRANWSLEGNGIKLLLSCAGHVTMLLKDKSGISVCCTVTSRMRKGEEKLSWSNAVSSFMRSANKNCNC